MSSTAEISARSNATPANRQFRVQYNARALWGVMAVLLLSGFAVLRLLTGASDAPQVDTSGTIDTIHSSPAAEMPGDDVHRLRPQTSAVLPPEDGLAAEETLHTAAALLTPDEGWNHLPATHWQMLSEGDEPSDVAREPDLLR